jgi:hypothetical protein
MSPQKTRVRAPQFARRVLSIREQLRSLRGIIRSGDLNRLDFRQRVSGPTLYDHYKVGRQFATPAKSSLVLKVSDRYRRKIVMPVGSIQGNLALNRNWPGGLLEWRRTSERQHHPFVSLQFGGGVVVCLPQQKGPSLFNG